MTLSDLITHFRMKANDTFPYLSPFVYQLLPVERPGIGTMAVDKQGRLYYDPDFVEKLTQEQGSYVVLHEATHLILQHCHRVTSIIGDNPTPQERRRLNIAYDLVIWEFLEAIEKDAPFVAGEPVTWQNMHKAYPKLVRNMLPHEIYAVMLEQDEADAKQQQPPPPVHGDGWMKGDDASGDEEEFDPETDDGGSGDEPGEEESDESGGEGDQSDASGEKPDGGGSGTGDPGDQEADGPGGSGSGEGEQDGDGKGGFKSDNFDLIGGGSAADGQEREYEEPPDENWEAFRENQLLDQVERKIKELEKDRSWQPSRGTAGLMSAVSCEIERRLRPQPNPWDQLRSTVSKAVKANRGAIEETWRQVNRRQYAYPQAPRMKGNETYSPKACVIIDTSGSMTPLCKLKSFNVVAQGLRAVGEFVVICGDTRVQTAVKLNCLAKLDIPLGGGTDMRPLIAHAEKEYKPDVIVICTDGGTPWPSVPTKAKLIVALTQELPTPTWAVRVRIPDEGKK